MVIPVYYCGENGGDKNSDSDKKTQQSADGDKNSDNQPVAVKNSICSD